MIIRRLLSNMVIPSKLNGKKGDCSMPSSLNADDFVSEDFVPGSLVWAKHSGYPWWPAMVEDDPDEEEYHRVDEDGVEEYHVVYITDKPEKVRRSWIPAKNLTEYVKPPTAGKSYVKRNWATALRMSKEIADTALPMSLTERLERFSFANLSNLKFPVVKKEPKVPKIPIKKNGRGRSVSAIPNKRRRHASAAVGTTNSNTAGNAATTKISHNVEIITTVSEVSQSTEISADPPSSPATDSNAVSSEIDTVEQTSNLPSAIDATQQSNSSNGVNEEMDSDAEEMAAFDKELELYSEGEIPSSPEYNKPLPEFLKNREIDELFSDCMSDSGSEDNVARPYIMECDSDKEQSPPGTSTEEPIKEKYVHTSEEDIWDINNPNLKRTFIWDWKDFQ